MNMFVPPQCLTRARRALVGNPFWKDDAGAMWQFAITIMFVMITASGVAINLMRFETERSRAQATADVSVLAAASFGQTKDAKQVVESYFDRAGLGDRLLRDKIQVTAGVNGKIVTVEHETETNAFFGKFLGYDGLRGTGVSQAAEYRGNVEVVMVLDISGSMRNNNRITNLKNAATNFVTELLDSDMTNGVPNNRISIAIVPYAGQVNLGPALFNRVASAYGMSDNVMAVENGVNLQNVRCVDVPTSQLSQPQFSPSPGLARTVFTDIFSSYGAQWGYTEALGHATWNTVNGVEYLNRTCFNDTRHHVRLTTNNKANLITYINNLFAIGGTSIDLGLKWGAWMLDPQSQPIMSQLVHNTSRVSSHFSDRPKAWDDPLTAKVVVLMTDGQHFEENRINPGFRSGNPPNAEIRSVTENGVVRYTIQHRSRAGANFWVPHLGQWQWGWYRGQWNDLTLSNAIPMQTMLNNFRSQWFAWEFYGRAFGWSYQQAQDHVRLRTDPTVMDGRLNSLCNDLKGKNVMIFGVAFEAPANGAQVIQSCASPDRFYPVAGPELTNAFRKIRGQITTLRLTQ